MRIRVQSNVPDAWVIGAIVLFGAAIVLAISMLRMGSVDPRPASPLEAPTALPAFNAAPVTAAPTGAPGVVDPGAPVKTFVPVESPLPGASNPPAPKTPDLPPPGYIKPEQN